MYIATVLPFSCHSPKSNTWLLSFRVPRLESLSLRIHSHVILPWVRKLYIHTARSYATCEMAISIALFCEWPREVRPSPLTIGRGSAGFFSYVQCRLEPWRKKTCVICLPEVATDGSLFSRPCMSDHDVVCSAAE